MDDPTVSFDLITFVDLGAATYSATPIPRAALRDRILFARTQGGNVAKLQVAGGDDLRITRLVVYDANGCIVRVASNLVIRSSFSCDLTGASEAGSGGDFWWHAAAAGLQRIEPRNGATFHVYRGFDDAAFAELHAAPYETQRVAREFVADQVIFCRTRTGRFAKLLVEAGDTLIVRRMVVFDAGGTLHLDVSNVKVRRTWLLDVDAGIETNGAADLWWEAVTNTEFYLTPRPGAAISFASYYRFRKYRVLLNNPPVRAALAFADAAGTRTYDLWSAAERHALDEFLYLRETGRGLPISGPPALTGDQFISRCDAWKIYLAHVAQSLWVEANHLVPWSIPLTSAETLRQLFDMRKLLLFTPGHGHSFDFGTMGAVTQWDPAFAYAFLTGNGFVKADHRATIEALADWCRANLSHILGFDGAQPGGPFASQPDQYQYLFGYRGLPPVEKMIQPLPGMLHTTHGCWGTSGFFGAVLRSVNLPVRHGRSNFDGFTHSRPEFFSAGRNFAHGDDPYNGWVRIGHNNVPIAHVFYDDAALHANIDAPPPLPGKTVPQTASFNAETKHLALAVQYKTNYLLWYRCQDRASNAPPATSEMTHQLHGHYTAAQIAAIVADCDAAIAAIPGGCPNINLP